MPNLAAVLKEEVRRLARKEIKAQVGTTKQTVAQYRREIAGLKRQLQQQHRRIAFLESQTRKQLGSPKRSAASLDDSIRFSARSVKAQRRKLGLSAKDYGRLVGVSGLTIYHWEQGKSRPRTAQLARLVAARNIGRREAHARLALSNGRA